MRFAALRHFVILTTAFFACVNGLVAQQVITNFQLYRTTEGLPSDYVMRLLEDTQGYLWVGTNDGLARFDGTEFETFPIGVDAVPSPTVSLLMQVNDSLVFIGGYSGLAVYNIRSNQFENDRITHPELKAGCDAVVNCAAMLPNGDVLVGAGYNVFVLGFKQQVLREKRLVNDLNSMLNVYNPLVFADRDSTKVLFSSNAHGLQILDLHSLEIEMTEEDFAEFFKNPNASYFGLTRLDNRDRFLSSTYWGEIALTDFVTDKKVRLVNVNPRGGEGYIRKVLRDPHKNDKWWLATRAGLKRFSDEDVSLQNFWFAFPVKDVFINGLIDMVIDRNGNMWLATESGLIKTTRLSWEFEARHPADAPYHNTVFNQAIGDKQGNVWMQTFGNGVFQLDKNGQPAKHHELSGNARMVFDLAAIDDTIYVATGAGVLRYDNAANSFQQTGLLPDSISSKWSATSLLYDSKGDFWLGCGGGKGLWRTNVKTDKGILYSHYDQPKDSKHYLPIRYPTSIVEDKDGNIWMGLNRIEGSLVQWNRSTETFEVVELNVNGQRQQRLTVSSLVTRGDKVWVATYNNGLLRYDLTNKTWTRYNTDHGLRGNSVLAVAFDRRNNLWVCGDAGIGVLMEGTDRFKTFGSREGLPLERLNWLGFPFAEHPDRLLFMGLDRYDWIDINDLVTPLPPLRVDLKRIEVENKPYSPTLENKFEHWQSHFTFHFTGVNLSSGTENRYAFMLEGVDKDWIDAGLLRNANYANVPPGRYTFKVKVRNVDGVWSEPASFSFSITPPFWDRWWFQTLAFLTCVGIAYAVYRVRVNRIVEMERVRSRISRDLHDDIGSTLSSINIITRSAKRRLNQQEYDKAVESIEKISDRTQRTLDNMSDIIWSIKPQNDSLGSVMWRMRDHASTVFEARGIDYTIDFPQGVDDVRLPLELKNNLFLVFKEAINNLVKYSNCKHATVRLSLEKHALRLVVMDDGVGFRMNGGPKGNGLNNMKRRAEESKAKLTIETAPGRGTVVEFVKKLP